MGDTNPIRLNDILGLSDNAIKNTKIRLNMNDPKNPTWNPIELFKDGNIQRLLSGHYHKGKKNDFKKGMITIALAKILGEQDLYLLFHIGKVTKELEVPEDGGVGYEYTEEEKFKPYYGRLIVKFHHKSQQNILKAENSISEMYVHKIIPELFSDDTFPGYENIIVTWKELERLSKTVAWKTALENQKGVYLITDSKTGKMYVGKATGEKMILQRWRDYLNNGHGGDVELKKIVEEKGFEYVKENFRYSILEIFDSKTDSDFILERENWWKKALLTRGFGLNKN